MSQQKEKCQVREIQNISSPASPPPPSLTGQLATPPCSPVELTQPSGLVVEIIGHLLTNRTDSAAILAAVAAQLSPPLLIVVKSKSDFEQPDSEQPASPPQTVEVLNERSREQIDMELRMHALSVSASASIKTPTAASEICESSPGRPTKPNGGPPESPSSLIVANDLPSVLLSSPSYNTIKQVLYARLDFTLRDWRTRNFYEVGAVVQYERWSDPMGQPHRDAAEALAELSDPHILGVPATMRSAHPEQSAASWDLYRRELIHCLHRAFAAGVDWRRALRALSLVYSNPEHGHPRIDQYVTSAISDRALVSHPLLHADVIIFKLDESFSHGSKKYSCDSSTAEWVRTTTRQPGEDIVTLATRVTEAYLKKINNPLIDLASVWETPFYSDEIMNRFEACIIADEICPSRGPRLKNEFAAIWSRSLFLIGRKEATRSTLNIIEIAGSQLQPYESAYLSDHIDLTDINMDDDDVSSVMSSENRTHSHRHSGTTGRAARERRASSRLALQQSP